VADQPLLRLGPTTTDRGKEIALSEIELKINQLIAQVDEGGLVGPHAATHELGGDDEVHLDWSQILGTPTSLAGYGITDAYTKAEVDAFFNALTFADIGGTIANAQVPQSAVTQYQAALSIGWGQLTGVPTTLAGYGITDAYTKTEADARYAPIVHTHDAAAVVSGTFADARISASSVTQHQAALSIAWGQLTGVPATFPTSLADITGFGADGGYIRSNGAAWVRVSGLALADANGNLAYARLPNIAGTWAVGGALSITGGVLTVAGLTSTATVALGINSLTMTGSIGATGARVTKGWFTDLESTNAIAASITGSAPTLTTTRTIWGQNFNGAANVSGAFSGATTMTWSGNVLNDLLFTDATYDIGKSGATRPRDGFFSRNLVISGIVGIARTPSGAQLDIDAGAGADAIYVRKAGASTITAILGTDGGGHGRFRLRNSVGTDVFFFGAVGTSWFDNGITTAFGLGTQVPLATLHVAGTTLFAADLKFTDATYDIGKTGATRPRDGFFSRNVIAAGKVQALAGLYFTSTDSYGLNFDGVDKFAFRANGVDNKVTIDLNGSIVAAGSLTVASEIQTGAPSGGTSRAWRMGAVAAVSPTSPNRTVEVEVNGTTYYLHGKTTNN
jgi:hypothetical protein